MRKTTDTDECAWAGAGLYKVGQKTWSQSAKLSDRIKKTRWDPRHQRSWRNRIIIKEREVALTMMTSAAVGKGIALMWSAWIVLFSASVFHLKSASDSFWAKKRIKNDLFLDVF